MSEARTRSAADVAPPGTASQAFVERVLQLPRAERAMLKRNAGKTLAEARGVAWFYGLLDANARRFDTEIHFLVATLIGLNPATHRGSFGRALATLKTRTNSEGVERRFRVLLDADFERLPDGSPAGGELAFRLRQMVKLSASHEVGVDWARLLDDLRRWNAPGRRVQKEWAADFYGAVNADEETPSGGVDATV